MARYYNKQKEMADQFVGTIYPKIRKKVAKNAEFTNVCYCLPSCQGVFEVHDREFTYIVDITKRVLLQKMESDRNSLSSCNLMPKT